jgi:hypothetical protein
VGTSIQSLSCHVQPKKLPRAVVGPGRSLPQPAEGCPDMQEWYGIRDTVVKDKMRTRLTKNPEMMDIQDDTLGETRKHQWNKEPRLKTATTGIPHLSRLLLS